MIYLEIPIIPFCGYPPANSPGIINVGAVQQAEDSKYPGTYVIYKEM